MFPRGGKFEEDVMLWDEWVRVFFFQWEILIEKLSNI